MIPLKLGLVAADGADLPLRVGGKPIAGDVIALTRPSRNHRVRAGAGAPGAVDQPRILRAGEAHRQSSADDLTRLAAHDSDPFNRWQALQTLATRLLVQQCRADPRRQRCWKATTA